MSTDAKPSITCYSGDEAGFMYRSQEMRARVLRPLLGVLHRCSVTANHVTLLSLMAGMNASSMKRVAVVGCGGAGKSRFSRELARRLGLPLIHLDAHYWRPGWTEPPAAQWEAAQRRLVQGDEWVIDGNYHTTLHLRTERADTVVFLDRSRWACLWGVLTRWIRNRGSVRPDTAPGCPEGLDLEFIRWVWNFPRRTRPTLLAALTTFEKAGGRVVYLRSRRTAGRFLESLG